LDEVSGFIVTAEVNGKILRLKVDPGANGIIALNPAAAVRIGLTETSMSRELASSLGIAPAAGAFEFGPSDRGDAPMGRGDASRAAGGSIARPMARIGPITAMGKLGRAQTRIASKTNSKLYLWFDKDVVSDADGLISPAELPYDNVTLQFRKVADAEKQLVFPTDYGPLTGLLYRHTVRGEALEVKLSTSQYVTTTTAAAGSLIAQLHDGSWSGQQQVQPITLEIMRPVRLMVLEKPFSIRGMQFRDMLVRVGDHRGGYDLPMEDSKSPGELVVTAKSAQAARLQLTVGADKLFACNSLTYSKGGRRLTLRCANALGQPSAI
jgi:hypothetical protein